MASTTTPEPAPAGTEAEPLKFTLQIISPSVGVPQPLIIQALPANATIKQLKERLRNILESRPSDQSQRLIHRGRLLAREEESMLNVFGEEALRSPDRQTLHLVLRDPETRSTFTPPPQPSANQSSGTAQQQGAGPHHHHHPPHPHPPHPAPPFPPQTHIRVGSAPWPVAGNPFGHHFQPAAVGFTTGVQPLNLPPGYTPQQFAQHQRQWLATMNAQMVRRMEDTANLNQRDRAGAQDAQPAGPQTTQHGTHIGGVASPFQSDAARTIVREGLGPNGQQWRITVNEPLLGPAPRQGGTGSPFSMADMPGPWRPPSGSPQPRPVNHGGPLSGPEVQNILRTVDTDQATRTMTDAMRRHASTSSLRNLANPQASHPVPPGVTTPSFMAQAARSNAGTPDPSRSPAIGRNNATRPSQTQTTPGTPEVYILSSPTGPRALLLNGNSEAFYTPQGRAAAQGLGLQNPLGMPIPGLWNGGAFPGMYPLPTQAGPSQRPPVGSGVPQPGAPRAQQEQPQPQQQQQAQGQPQNGLAHLPGGQPRPVHAVARPDNAQIEAVRIANLWPAVWGLFRLSLFLFIWWYTSPTASWSRLLVVISIAITIFLANAGLLAPLTGHIWVPVRQHLQNLIPPGEGHHRDAQQHGRGGNADAGNGGAQRALDPADTAARLVQQRRERNANWLTNQVRRLERAGILFLASIAPGVLERHIAHLEADARAERQRREAEAAAAAAAAAEADAENARNEAGPEGTGPAQENTAASTGVDQQNQPGGAEADGVRARAPHAEGPPVAA